MFPKKSNLAYALRAALGPLSLVALTAFAQAPAETRHAQIYVNRERTMSASLRAQLLATRQQVAASKFHFTVGYTEALDHPLAEITGGLKISDSKTVPEQNAISKQLLDLDRAAFAKALKADPDLRRKIPLFRIAPKPTDSALDWRKHGMVSPVHRQLKGTCWAYGSVGALDCSSRLLNNQPIDGSEQYVITNAIGARSDPNNFNGGGWAWKAIDYLVKQGTVTDASCPDIGTAGTPNPNAFKPYGGIIWGFCHGSNGMATVAEIKQALCEHGPVASWVDAGGTFGSYTGDVYDDTSTNHQVGGHFVLIIGWDSAKGAWLIKNSWGTTWGDTCGYGSERGYMWIKYGVHGIGTDAAWIHDHPTKYQIDMVALAKILKVSKLMHKL